MDNFLSYAPLLNILYGPLIWYLWKIDRRLLVIETQCKILFNLQGETLCTVGKQS